jgi:aminoglycoside 6'-N-acetyltransferase I
VTSLEVRQFRADERALWGALRARLWPDAEPSELDQVQAVGTYLGFGAWSGGEPVGFAELSLRPFANGCQSTPVPFLEGVWVEPEGRRSRVGAELITACEAWAREAGYVELGSDTEQDNSVSLQAHVAWGFQETERIVCLRKALS